MTDKQYWQRQATKKQPTAAEIKKQKAAELATLKAKWALEVIVAFEGKPLIQRELCNFFGYKSLADVIIANDIRGK